jgi:hypothetical protein
MVGHKKKWSKTMERVTLNIATVDKDGNVIPADKRNSVLIGAMESISRLFGGCTVTKQQGAWWDGNKVVIEENDFVWSIVSEEDRKMYKENILRIREWIKTELNQQSVMYLVEPVTEVAF